MIRGTREIKVRAGKQLQAIGWGKEVAGYIQKTHNTPDNTKVLFEIFSDLATLTWSTDYESLAQLEELDTKINADPKYQEMVQKAIADDLFVEGSIRDRVHREF